jgi:hypothetical protein
MKKLKYYPLLLSLIVCQITSKGQAVNGIQKTEVDENMFNEFDVKPDEPKLTTYRTLNSFFATKTSTYLSQATDLSLSKAYAVLDNTDGRLFIGGTFNQKKKNSDTSRFLFTLGAKANVKDGFAKIFASNSFNNDIGLSLKVTLFGRGTIWFDEDAGLMSQKAQVAHKRALLKKALIKESKEEVAEFKATQDKTADGAEELTKYINTNEEEKREKFATEEAKFIINKKLFNVSHDWWVSLDAYMPVTESTYEIATDFKSTQSNKENYRPYEVNLVYTNFWEKNKFIGNPFLLPGTTLLTVKGSLIANNSVKASLIDEYGYDKYLVQNLIIDTMFMAKLKNNTVYVGNFEKFVTPRLSARFVYMPVSFIGVSSAIEKSFGKIDDLNWRLGLPVSLKDNEGKAKVNFEIVWKEVHKEHVIGLSVGLPIGQTIF